MLTKTTSPPGPPINRDDRHIISATIRLYVRHIRGFCPDFYSDDVRTARRSDYFLIDQIRALPYPPTLPQGGTFVVGIGSRQYYVCSYPTAPYPPTPKKWVVSWLNHTPYPPKRGGATLPTDLPPYKCGARVKQKKLEIGVVGCSTLLAERGHT